MIKYLLRKMGYELTKISTKLQVINTDMGDANNEPTVYTSTLYNINIDLELPNETKDFRITTTDVIYINKYAGKEFVVCPDVLGDMDIKNVLPEYQEVGYFISKVNGVEPGMEDVLDVELRKVIKSNLDAHYLELDGIQNIPSRYCDNVIIYMRGNV